MMLRMLTRLRGVSCRGGKRKEGRGEDIILNRKERVAVDVEGKRMWVEKDQNQRRGRGCLES